MTASGQQVAKVLDAECERRAMGYGYLAGFLHVPVATVTVWLTDADSMPIGLLARLASLLDLLPSELL